MYYWKEPSCKWTQAVQTCVVQGSTVVSFLCAVPGLWWGTSQGASLGSYPLEGGVPRPGKRVGVSFLPRGCPGPGGKRPGLLSLLTTSMLCDLGQVTAPLGASAPIHVTAGPNPRHTVPESLKVTFNWSCLLFPVFFMERYDLEGWDWEGGVGGRLTKEGIYVYV